MTTRKTTTTTTKRQQSQQQQDEQQLLLSLPPIPKNEQASILDTIQKTIPGYQESSLQTWKERQCLEEEVHNATTPFAEALLNELQTQMDKQYGNHHSSSSSSHFVARHSVTVNKEGDGNSTTNTTSSTGQGQSLMIRTYVELCEPHKFRTGKWSSEWKYNGSSNNNNNKTNGGLVSGSITMHVHYYEDDSNIQLRGTRVLSMKSLEQITTTTTTSSSSSTTTATTINNNTPLVDTTTKTTPTIHASAIVQLMQRASLQYYEDLSCQLMSSSSSMSSSLRRQEPNGNHNNSNGNGGTVLTSLKQLRRILPITKTRMKWDDAAQESIQLLNDTKAQKQSKPKGSKNKTKTTTSKK